MQSLSAQDKRSPSRYRYEDSVFAELELQYSVDYKNDPPPKTDLSFMEDFEPCELTYRHFTVDPHGYSELASNVYDEITASLPATDDEVISKQEFVLASGYLLAHRVLSSRENTDDDPWLEGFAEFDKLIGSPEIPAPLSDYLGCVGPVPHASGVELIPDIVLPRMDDSSVSAGVLPSLESNRYRSKTLWQASSAMFQFGLLERQIVADPQDSVNSAVWPLSRVDPYKTDPVLDVHLYNAPNNLPFFNCMSPVPEKRRALLRSSFFRSEPPDIRNSVRWSEQLWSCFLVFLQNIGKHVVLVKYPRFRNGSASQLVVASPLNPDNPGKLKSFQFESPVPLTRDQIHEARLFRFRYDINDYALCSEPDYSDYRWSALSANLPYERDNPTPVRPLLNSKFYLAYYVKKRLFPRDV